MDWKEAAMSGGAVAVAVEIVLFAIGRSDLVKERRDRRTREIALSAVRESGEFAKAKEQNIVNENVLTSLERIETSISQIHTVLFSRRGD
jgi:hypothetical protein